MIEYRDAKALATDADPETRRRLAERADVQPEILYFLAEDDHPEVRTAIAANSGTPRQADLILASDRDAGVRERVAQKICRLAPDLPQEDRANIRELTLDVIAILAGDRTVRIRQIVAEALKDLTDVPAEAIRRLARDVEIRVAAPVLEHSPLLSDATLIEIIQSKPIQGALSAIARRRRLGAKLSDALVATAVSAPDGAVAVATLLKNHAAEIDTGTMDRLLDLAPNYAAWHAPLVQRPVLPPMAFRRLAGFVSVALLDLLQSRGDTDPETAAAISETVQRRLAESEGAGRPVNEIDDGDEIDGNAKLPVGEAEICRVAESGDVALAAAALARDSGMQQRVIRKILASSSPKAIVALAWKAGHTMKMALVLQSGPGRIPPEHRLASRAGDGGFPLTVSELAWQLEIFQAPERTSTERRPTAISGRVST
ncbi:MAG TPA: DUF2336 domain-containing protein [Dongiaceae bacterium]